MKKLLAILILCQSMCFAEIFGVDDRLEAFEEMPSVLRQNLRSSVALVPKNRLSITDNGVSILSNSLAETLRMCENSRFSNQPLLANCSGSLVGNDTVLTAAHCLPDDKQESCDEYYYVFDYEVGGDGKVKTLKKENIFECQKIIHHDFDTFFSKTGLDLALVKLKRAVSDRTPYKVNFSEISNGDEIFMIGYPLGAPKKVSHGATVKDSPFKNSFSSDLDTFSVNSGSPIFDRNTGDLIGVLVRGTGANLRSVGQCNDWSYAEESGFADGNNLLSIKEILEGIND
ncbi:serine protease [Bacteriovorax sp. Seq25_V]|uniref:trypsin-like serine peptidase n=1 Tax=Bacteriovorax sp. Seq25_V TaxID=1201288 RepID=UPI000389F4E5|nr:serine protease [Bacteriovorax sp. Seq25_V]EQC45559.1 trypsin [Bacteriovorax sp. Seq25_V]